MKYFGINVVATVIGVIGVLLIAVGALSGLPMISMLASPELVSNPFLYSAMAIPATVFISGCFLLAIYELFMILISLDKNLDICADKLIAIDKREESASHTKGAQ